MELHAILLKRIALTSVVVPSICLFASPLAAQTNFVFIKGHRAHPTRILARCKNADQIQTQAAVTTLSFLGLDVVRHYELVSGLILLDESSPRVAPATVAAQTPTDPKAQAKRLLDRIASLQNSGLFEYVEPDYIVSLTTTPTDAAFADGTLWGLRNSGQQGGTPGCAS